MRMTFVTPLLLLGLSACHHPRSQQRSERHEHHASAAQQQAEELNVLRCSLLGEQCQPNNDHERSEDEHEYALPTPPLEEVEQYDAEPCDH